VEERWRAADNVFLRQSHPVSNEHAVVYNVACSRSGF
jgi:hypothetical protein